MASKFWRSLGAVLAGGESEGGSPIPFTLQDPADFLVSGRAIALGFTAHGEPDAIAVRLTRGKVSGVGR